MPRKCPLHLHSARGKPKVMVGLDMPPGPRGDVIAALIMPVTNANSVQYKLELVYYEEIFPKPVEHAQVITDDCGRNGLA
jgi:hypothetical protein